MKSRILPAIAALLFAASSNAQTSCAASYAAGTAPKIVNAKMGAKTQEICYEGYTTMFSGVTRTPLWSAEHLTKDRVEQACEMKRHDAFHPDPNLAADIRSELDDYKNSGFDRGHMAPSGDMPTPTAQAESFSLANMSPQLHANNAGIWEKLENGTRNLAISGHEVYMVSGPMFEGSQIKQLKGRVMVPTSFFKAVYDDTSKRAGVFITTNSADKGFTLISVDDLKQRVGIDVFPNLPADVKTGKASVISPANRTNCEGK